MVCRTDILRNSILALGLFLLGYLGGRVLRPHRHDEFAPDDIRNARENSKPASTVASGAQVEDSARITEAFQNQQSQEQKTTENTVQCEAESTVPRMAFDASTPEPGSLEETGPKEMKIGGVISAGALTPDPGEGKIGGGQRKQVFESTAEDSKPVPEHDREEVDFTNQKNDKLFELSHVALPRSDVLIDKVDDGERTGDAKKRSTSQEKVTSTATAIVSPAIAADIRELAAREDRHILRLLDQVFVFETQETLKLMVFGHLPGPGPYDIGKAQLAFPWGFDTDTLRTVLGSFRCDWFHTWTEHARERKKLLTSLYDLRTRFGSECGGRVESDFGKRLNFAITVLSWKACGAEGAAEGEEAKDANSLCNYLPYQRFCVHKEFDAYTWRASRGQYKAWADTLERVSESDDWQWLFAENIDGQLLDYCLALVKKSTTTE
ncbi:MAG: hypothetical protein K9N51_05740 [Candidatus Pacebacteria bacterium]|nr:hypothetical protein [Candidatus Paceibacterota bacterium]